MADPTLAFDWTAPGNEASGQAFIRAIELGDGSIAFTMRDSCPHVPMSVRVVMPAAERVALIRWLAYGTGIELSGGPVT